MRQFETALKAALIVVGPDEAELNDEDAWSIIWNGINDLVKTKGGGRPLPSMEFLLAADGRAATFYRKETIDYVLVTSLSVASLPRPGFKIGDWRLRAVPDRAKRYPIPSTLTKHYAGAADTEALPRGYQCVAVETQGRSVFEAADQALANVTLLRGLWTLFETYGSWSISAGSVRRRPIGVVHGGPIHTLHHPEGPAAGDMFWYASERIEIERPFKPRDWAVVEKHQRWAQRRLSTLSYRQDLKDLIRRYAVALDQSNLDIAFLHLWSILEKVTDTVGAKYDETIRRAVWAYKDKDVAKEMLEALRLHRNRVVHGAQSHSDRDQVAYMIKLFVEPHLMRLLRNDFKVISLEDYAQYLALPSSLDAVEKISRRAAHARRIMLRWAKEA